MHKRILSAVALGAVATLALAGCAGGTDAASTDGKGQELTVWIMKGTNPRRLPPSTTRCPTPSREEDRRDGQDRGDPSGQTPTTAS